MVAANGLAGAERHLMALLPALAATGWRVALLNVVREACGPVHPALERQLAALESSGVAVHRAGVKGRYDLAGARAVARLVRALRPELVHTHLVYADLFGALGARLGGARTVVTTHHYDYSFDPRERRRFRAWYALADCLATHHVAISARMQTLLREDERLPAAHVSLVRYGCPDGRVDRTAAGAHLRHAFGIGEDAVVAGTVARLVAWKGHRFAIEALARLRAEGLPLHLVFVGDGPERAALDAHARACGVAGALTVTGFREDVPRLMAGLDLLVHPPLGEGFGLVLLEAMVQATPIVATRTGALPEIVADGETGWLCSPGRSDALADAMRHALTDPARLRAAAAAGRRRYEQHFTVARMARETHALYERLRAGS